MKFKWTAVKQKSFYEVNLIVACDTLSVYSDFNKQFDIHTDAINFQLGAVMINEFRTTNFIIGK